MSAAMQAVLAQSAGGEAEAAPPQPNTTVGTGQMRRVSGA